MKYGLRMSVAAGALLAAMGSASLAAADAADLQANTENGVHAAPTEPVAAQTLAAPVSATARTVKIESVEQAKPANSAAPPRLTVEVAKAEPAAPVPAATPPAEPPAPSPVQMAQANPDPVATPVEAPAAEQPAVLAETDASGPGPEESRAYGNTEPAVAVTDADGNGEAVLQAARSVRRAAPEAAPEPPPARQGSGLQQHVAFPREAAEAAAAFDGYMHRAGRIDAALASGGQVRAALETASAYDAHQLEEGMIAYGAIAALQSPRFVYAVMDAAANDGARRELIDQVLSNPGSATQIPGAADAAVLASAAIAQEARPVVASGRALKQAAYDVQHSSWSTAKATDPEGRLARAKAASAARIVAHDGDVARLLTQVSSATPGDSGRGSPFTEVSERSVALAALAILDGAGGDNAPRLGRIVSEDISAQCLKMAKLNLFQCLSVAGPEYEDVFCLGQHAVLDTGQCVAAAASPVERMLMSALPGRSNDGDHVMVPMGGMSRAP